jgi:hypothetical protein
MSEFADAMLSVVSVCVHRRPQAAREALADTQESELQSVAAMPGEHASAAEVADVLVALRLDDAGEGHRSLP